MTLPGVAGRPAKAEPAGRAQRQAEDSIVMGLVAVPADADADVVFGAKNLPNSCRGAAERFDFLDRLCQPVWHRFGPLQQTQVIVVAEAERGDPPLTFELAELKGLERVGPDLRNEFLFDSRRNEVGSVAQPLRLPW